MVTRIYVNRSDAELIAARQTIATGFVHVVGEYEYCVGDTGRPATELDLRAMAKRIVRLSAGAGETK